MKSEHYNFSMSQQCKRCVMDGSDPSIRFDAEGYCNHCTDFLSGVGASFRNIAKRQKAFEKRVEAIKKDGEGKRYDAIIGFSGGADSAYAAYICHKAGLRLLAVNVDNGWNSEVSLSNMQKVAKQLPMDLEIVKLQEDVFRDLQVAFLKAAVPEAEAPTDMAIPAVLHKIADKYNVKHIISGGNFATEGILPKFWSYNAKDMRYFTYIAESFGNVNVDRFPTFGFLKESYYKLIKGMSYFYPLNDLPYDKEAILPLLKETFEWENYGGKHHESLYTKFIQAYYLPVKFGIDYRKATFSTQICAGTMTREEAIKLLDKLPYDPEMVEENLQFVADKLKLQLDDLKAIMNFPPKWYTDYPNQEQLISSVYSAYRFLFNKKKVGHY